MRWVDVPKSFVRAFMDMHDGTMTDRNTTNAITMEQFADGWNFHDFPLTSTLEDNAWIEPVHNCTTTVIVRFNRLEFNRSLAHYHGRFRSEIL
ncbi:hypothetical protein AAVH_39230, partial [Aphelenchoides avenae]